MKGHFVYGMLRSARNHFRGSRIPLNHLPVIIILNIAAREHPHAGSKQMATHQAVVIAQTQSSSSSSNLCCSVATQTWSAHHVACSLLHTIHYASSMTTVWRTPIIQSRPQTALLLLLLYIFSPIRNSSLFAALLSLPLFIPPLYFFH